MQPLRARGGHAAPVSVTKTPIMVKNNRRRFTLVRATASHHASRARTTTPAGPEPPLRPAVGSGAAGWCLTCAAGSGERDGKIEDAINCRQFSTGVDNWPARDNRVPAKPPEATRASLPGVHAATANFSLRVLRDIIPRPPRVRGLMTAPAAMPQEPARPVANSARPPVDPPGLVIAAWSQVP